jgi:hydroxymethylglutaryl-CoA lyase
VGAGAKRVVKPVGIGAWGVKGIAAKGIAGPVGPRRAGRVPVRSRTRYHPLVSPTPSRVTLVEVSPRDGLQNEKAVLPASVKVELVDRLSAAGFGTIEVTSFVSPKAIPQLADADQVMAGITRRKGVRYTVLVPNLKGWERAVATRPDGIVVFGAASETFSQRNINCTIAESIERFRPVVAAAKAAKVAVRGTISCALGCPYEGEIAPAAVAALAREMLGLGVDELSIADTIGIGTVQKTNAVLDAVLPLVDTARLNMHFHDTYARALANIGASLDRGVRSFDSSAAGLGGCPFAPGATGNVATEAVLELMEERGMETGVNTALLRETGQWIRGKLNS